MYPLNVHIKYLFQIYVLVFANEEICVSGRSEYAKTWKTAMKLKESKRY